MAPTIENKVSSNYILDDMVFSILSKLPVKSIKRFSCARKSWSLLFENPNFIKMYRENLISKYHPLFDDSCLILKQIAGPDFHWNFYLLSGDNFENKVKMNLPPPFHIQYNGVDLIFILGSAINGTLCIYNCANPEKVMLWNPATEEIKVIPPSLGEFSREFTIDINLHGFGYDHISDDYKVIQRVRYTPVNDSKSPCDDLTPKPFWEIYSLKSNSRKKLNFDMPIRYMHLDNEVFLNGVCHWLGKKMCGVI